MSASSPAERAPRLAPPLAAALSIGSLWCYASAGTPHWLELVTTPLALGAVALALWARRHGGGTASALALVLGLVVLASELAFSLLARM